MSFWVFMGQHVTQMLSGHSYSCFLRYLVTVCGPLVLSRCWCVYLGIPNTKDSFGWHLGDITSQV